MAYPYDFYFVSQADVFGGMLRSWTFWGILLCMLAVSAYHERKVASTEREYVARRTEAGGEAGDWPREGSLAMRLGPQFLLPGAAVAALIGAAQVLNTIVSETLDVLMRAHDAAPALPMVAPAVIALGMGIALFLLARRVQRSPWYPVAERVRRAVHAPRVRRDQLFAEALALDPGIPRADDAGD